MGVKDLGFFSAQWGMVYVNTFRFRSDHIEVEFTGGFPSINSRHRRITEKGHQRRTFSYSDNAKGPYPKNNLHTN